METKITTMTNTIFFNFLIAILAVLFVNIIILSISISISYGLFDNWYNYIITLNSSLLSEQGFMFDTMCTYNFTNFWFLWFIVMVLLSFFANKKPLNFKKVFIFMLNKPRAFFLKLGPIFIICFVLYITDWGVGVLSNSLLLHIYTLCARIAQIKLICFFYLSYNNKKFDLNNLSISKKEVIFILSFGLINYYVFIPYLYVLIPLFLNKLYIISTRLHDLFQSPVNGEEITNNLGSKGEITNNIGKGVYDILKKFPMFGRYLDDFFSNLKAINNVYVDSPFRNHITPLVKKVIIYPFNKISKFTSINLPQIVENHVEVSYVFKTPVNNFKLFLINNSEYIKDYVYSSVFKYSNFNLSLKVGLDDQGINTKASFKNGCLESYTVEKTRVKDSSYYSKPTDNHNFTDKSILTINSNPLSYLWDLNLNPNPPAVDMNSNLTVFMNNPNDFYSNEPFSNEEIKCLISDLSDRKSKMNFPFVLLKDLGVHMDHHTQIIRVNGTEHLLLTRLYRLHRDLFSNSTDGRVLVARTEVRDLIGSLDKLISSNTNVHGESSNRRNNFNEQYNPNLPEGFTYGPPNFKSDFWASAYSSPVFDIWNNAHFSKFDDSGNFCYFILDVRGKFYYHITDMGGHVHYPAINELGQIHYPSFKESMNEPLKFSNQGFEQSSIYQSINLSTNQGFQEDQELRNRNFMRIENQEGIEDRNIRMAIDNSIKDMDTSNNNPDVIGESSWSNYYNTYQESTSNSNIESRYEPTDLNRNNNSEEDYNYIIDVHRRFILEDFITDSNRSNENRPQEESSIRNNKDASAKEPDTGKNEEWSGKGKGKRKR